MHCTDDMMNERNIWDQMEGENDLWYRRFCLYLRMGSKRSVNALFKRTTKKNQEEPRGNAGPDWYDAEKTWNWKERARAYDEHLRAEEEKQRKEDLEAVRNMLLEHIAAEVSVSSGSQIQAAKLLLEHYVMVGDLAQMKEQLQALQEKLEEIEATP